MRDGDRAGVALLRDSSASIGVQHDGGVTRVVMVSGPTMDSDWNTTGTGAGIASVPVADSTTFTRLGPALSTGDEWRFSMTYRFAPFNHATQALGGSAHVTRFELSTP